MFVFLILVDSICIPYRPILGIPDEFWQFDFAFLCTISQFLRVLVVLIAL